jgi:hypothetical protein
MPEETETSLLNMAKSFHSHRVVAPRILFSHPIFSFPQSLLFSGASQMFPSGDMTTLQPTPLPHSILPADGAKCVPLKQALNHQIAKKKCKRWMGGCAWVLVEYSLLIMPMNPTAYPLQYECTPSFA